MTTLRWKYFERATWARARRELRTSVQGWKEYKRRRWARWFSSTGIEDKFVLRITAPLVLLAMLPGLNGVFRAQAEGFLALWTIGSIFRRASQLNSVLYRSPRLHLFNHLPIANAEIFREQVRVWWRQSLWVTVDLAMLCTVLLQPLRWVDRLWGGWWLGVMLWLFVLSAAVALAAWKPRRNFEGTGLLLRMAAFMYAFHWVPDFVAKGVAGVSGFLPPASLLVQLLAPAAGLGAASGLLAICLYLAGLAAGQLGLRRLRTQYCLTTMDFEVERQLSRKGTVVLAGIPSETEAPARPEAEAEAEAALRHGLRTPAFDWAAAPFVERVVGSVLTPRERAVAELLLGSTPRWTRNLKWLAAFCVLAMALLWLAKGFALLLMPLAAWGLIFIFGAWSGTGITYAAGTHVPPHAWLPVGIHEVSWTMIKINWMRLAFALPVLIFILLALVSQQHFTGMRAVWIGVRLVYLGIIIQPMFAVFLFNHSQGSLIRELMSLLILAGFMIASVAAAMAFVFLDQALMVILLGLALAVLSLASILMFQHWLYHGRVDFVLRAPASIQPANG